MSMYYYINDATNKIEIQDTNIQTQVKKKLPAFGESSIINNNLPLTVYQITGPNIENSKLTFVSDRIYDIRRRGSQRPFPILIEKVHPEDREPLHRSRQTSIAADSPWQFDFRIILENENLRWIHGEAIPYHLTDGTVTWNG